MTTPQQQKVEVHAGVADEDSKKRKLLIEIKESVKKSDKMEPEEKEDFLKKLNKFNLMELEETRMELLKDGKALLEDREKQEKGREV